MNNANLFLAILIPLSVSAMTVDGSPDDWVWVSPHLVGAKVLMPLEPRYVERTFQPVKAEPPVVVRMHLATLPDKTAQFGFGYHDLYRSPGTNRNKIDEILDGARIGAVARVLGKLIDEQEIMVAKNRGRDFVYTCIQDERPLKIKTRVVLVKKRLFHMNYIAEAQHYDEKLADKMFASFELVDLPVDAPPAPRPGRAKPIVAGKKTSDSSPNLSGSPDVSEPADKLHNSEGSENSETSDKTLPSPS
jgi:hypothetical protein